MICSLHSILTAPMLLMVSTANSAGSLSKTQTLLMYAYIALLAMMLLLVAIGATAPLTSGMSLSRLAFTSLESCH